LAEVHRGAGRADAAAASSAEADRLITGIRGETGR
jgi:hypothetical protein